VTLGVKYELVTLIFGGACHHLISDAHDEREQQFLMRKLSAHISSLRVCSTYFEGTFSNFEFLCLR
jgi:hypothetical protein